MDWIQTPHSRNQLAKRKVPKSLVEMTLNNPDEIVPGHKDRIVYHKIIDASQHVDMESISISTKLENQEEAKTVR